MDPTVLYRVDRHVAYITLNRPQVHNAMDTRLRRELRDVFHAFRDDAEAHVAILHGAGPSFCSGADMKEPAGDAAGVTAWDERSLDHFDTGMELWKPVIGAIHGHAIGAGCSLVAACDFAIAAEGTQFSWPELAKVGVVPPRGAIHAARRLRWHDAMELVLLGESVDAERALEIGLVWRVVPAAALLDEARALADRLAALSPTLVQATKELALRGRDGDPFDAFRYGMLLPRLARITQPGDRTSAD
jgi:E-phenylitaconyl-CoA hydratase